MYFFLKRKGKQGKKEERKEKRKREKRMEKKLTSNAKRRQTSPSGLYAGLSNVKYGLK